MGLKILAPSEPQWVNDQGRLKDPDAAGFARAGYLAGYKAAMEDVLVLIQDDEYSHNDAITKALDAWNDRIENIPQSVKDGKDDGGELLVSLETALRVYSEQQVAFFVEWGQHKTEEVPDE